MTWRKRHKRAPTNIPTRSPVPAGTEVFQRYRQEPPRLPLLREVLSYTWTTDSPTLQRNWGPKFPAVQLGIPRRHRGAEVAHVIPLKLASGAGDQHRKGAGVQGDGTRQRAKPAAWEDFVMASRRWVEFAGRKHKLKHAQRE